jgi:hypothetical protein
MNINNEFEYKVHIYYILLTLLLNLVSIFHFGLFSFVVQFYLIHVFNIVS